MKTFKAGDFTSGKMGEIFKSCYIEDGITTISHKQFGLSYLIPEQYVKFVCIHIIKQDKGILDLLKEDHSISVVNEFLTGDSNDGLEFISNYFMVDLDTWFEVLVNIAFLRGGDCDQDMQDTKTDL
tara:strand:- start:456 stop:833 length:378 start_codon:yes stop_codon:yes gene_type:complete